jgi:hypothetical protein
MGRAIKTTFKEETYEIVREALIEMLLEAEDEGCVEQAARDISDYLPSSLISKSGLRRYVQRILFDLKESGLIERVPDTTRIEFRLVARVRERFLDATRRGHTAIVRKLLDRGIDTDTKNAALVSAVINNRTEIVRLLVDFGAEVNRRDALFARTPLMYATSRTSKEIVRLLTAAGAEEDR